MIRTSPPGVHKDTCTTSSRHEPVEMVGQYSIRGGILDVYSPGAATPVRIEMLGDEVESIRDYDPGTQKSIQRVDEAALLPLTEFPYLDTARICSSPPGIRPMGSK